MEVLAKAAVAEICKLVDDGYAVLRLEISRSEKENQTLKRKLQMLEVMVARGYADAGLRDSSPECRPDGVQVCDALREGHFANSEKAFGSRLGIGLWRAREPTTVDEVDTVMQSITQDEAADMEEGRPESQPIKEEALEWDVENSDPQAQLKISGDRAVVSDPDGSERADTQTAPAIDTEELTEQHRTRHSVWEDSGLDAVLKAEPENETVNLQDAESELGAQKLNILDYEDIIHEGPCQQEFFITQGVTEKDNENPAVSRTTESDTDNLSVQSELLSGKSLPSLGSLDVKREEEMIDSELLKVEAEAADMEEGRPESQPIKEEALEWDVENSDPQAQLKISGDSKCDGGLGSCGNH
ncbi:retinitis pigmentosa 1-like 1 protein [Megalops cyprinoides]|uniref:retinitis pigmentosa 1-like 1 protein n=1 Tax=Megalops cyprinoides TaxID=118141 RepID=UPI00186505B9|nr:retinitis pigmentosa 1-like 1 protein [Megalops cyprinoides]